MEIVKQEDMLNELNWTLIELLMSLFDLGCLDSLNEKKLKKDP